MKELIGKTIKEIWIDDNEQTFLKFVTDSGDFIYYAYGDCCSESWFNDIDGVEFLLNHKVLQVKEIEVCDKCVISKSRQEYDEINTIVLVTDKGIADIIFRNSSNGYYGGSCELVDEINEHHDVKMIKVEKDYFAK